MGGFEVDVGSDGEAGGGGDALGGGGDGGFEGFGVWFSRSSVHAVVLVC